MIKDIKELNFPAYATLETATATIADMGDRTITSQVKIDGDVVPDFSYDWEVEFKGERYIHPVKTPQGTKDNTSRKSKIDLVFHHWAIYEMKRQYFVEMASTSAGTAIADKYIASLGLNLGDFVTAFNLVLNHYFGGRIIINLNPEWQYDTEAKFVSISYSYIWDVLQQIHEIYGVRWTLKTNADGVCEILMGYPTEEVSHIFEYGFEGGLLSVQHQVQSTEIRNRLLGRGGSKNLPARYFKDKDPNNPLFEADPDWIPELANITFTELRGKTFRDYVRGWKAKRYGGTPMAEPTEAYLAGYNAEKFDPIEYVDDKESIEKYGILVGALENNEEIYPSIQGAPGDVDMIVDAEQVTDDDVDAAVENDSVTTNLESGHQTYRNAPANSTITIETLTKRYFSVPAGKVGNLDMSLTVTGKYSNVGDYEPTYPILKTETVNITVHDSNTDEIVKSSVAPVVNLPAGDYYYMITADVETNYDKESMVTLNIESVRLYVSTPGVEGWSQTFDIWVRNIWGSERNAGETDQQYADRVWLPILGDRMGDEARVVFASGWLSFSSDWEFPIVGYAYDDSKEGSHWRLTLAKSEAELEASGKYIPYEGYNASAGDRFFFIGIDMPWQYVYWGEERIDDYKRDTLPETARINPSWVIKTDKVRLNQNREGAKLIDSLSVGAQIRLASKQFISGSYESLYVQSMTYNWTANTILYPDVEVVVSDKVATVKNPVAQMQGNIETLQRQVGSLSNIQQIIRQVCDQLYLRKDGVEDLSKSPTRFLGKVTGKNFRQGQIGGKDWGIYRDENGNAILEADKLVARQGILVTDLVVNEATYVGGLQIRSAAHMDVTSVEDTEAGYVCSFDQKQGSVTNKFTEDDVVLCQKFDADQSEVKFYKRRVVSVSETSVTLSKTDVNGTGVPAEGDVIIHYGNYADKSRQFVIISDVIGGGYERMLMGLDSVASDGVEYYFAGKSADSKARWFVGDSKQYAKYENGQITIKGNLLVTGSDKPITDQIAELDYIKDAFGEGAQGLILGSAIIVGDNDDAGKFIPMAGLSGVYDATKPGGGIAAWYGGNMVDAEDGTGAQSLFRFDGSGYLAGGNIRWDKDGAGAVAGGDISWDKDGNITLGYGIKISSDGDETLGTILAAVNKIFDLFTEQVDSEGNTTAIIANYNLYSRGGLTARYQGGESGGSGGGASNLWELNDVTITNPTNGQSLVYRDGVWVNEVISGGSGEYLPLIGGVLNGNLQIGDDDNTAYRELSIKRNGVTTYIATTGAGEASFNVTYADGVGHSLLLRRDAALYADGTNYNYLLHSGNIGSYTAGSATKLQTARTIWGQSFDGTRDIDGTFKYCYINLEGGNEINCRDTDKTGLALYLNRVGAGNVIMVMGGGNVLIGTTVDSGAKLRIQTKRADTFTWNLGNLASKSDMALEFCPDGSNIYGLYTAINYGSGDAAMQVGRSDGLTNAYNLCLQPLGGNVGIGTISPSAKLDVVGGRFRCMSADAGTTYDMHHGFITGYHGIDVMQFFENEYRFYANGGESGCLVNVYGNLYASGNALIDTTTDNGAKLQVAGGIHISRENFYGEYDEGIRIEGTSSDWCGVFLGTSSERRGYQDSQWYLLRTNTNSLRIGRGVSSTSYLEINEYGKIGVGKTNQVYELDVEGSIRTTTGNVRVHHTNSDMCLELLHTHSSYSWNYIRQVSNGYEWHIGITSDVGTSYTYGSDWLYRGAYEIRGNGGRGMNGIFVRYDSSNYGKLVVANSSNAETSIGYLNPNYSYYYPVWTVGTNIGDGNITTFGWFFADTEAKAWLTSSGNFYVKGGLTARYASDIRLKEDIKAISTEVALQTIMALNPITFKWNSKATELCSWLNGESQGFIAQEYESLIPNSGSEMWGQYRGIDYNRAIPYMVAVAQNHEQRIKQLEEELQTLKREYYGNR